MFYVIVHGYAAEGIHPFVWISGNEENYKEHLKDLQTDIEAGGRGILLWHGATDNIEMDRFWVMPFNK